MLCANFTNLGTYLKDLGILFAPNMHFRYRTNGFFLIGIITAFFFVQVHSCPNDCRHNGHCVGGACVCRYGHFKDDCSGDLIDTHKNQLIIVQAYLATLFVIISTVSAVSLFYGIKKVEQQTLGDNIKNIVFAVFLFICFTQALYCAIDPTSQWGVMPRVANEIIYGLNRPLGICALVAILFHWVDIINLSMDRLNKEHMFQKINKNYKRKDVTLEEVVHKVKFLSRLKFPFAIFAVFVFISMMSLTIVGGLDIQLFLLDNIVNAELAICYIVLTIGFLVYGRRLVSLMPYELTKKVRRFTFKLTLLSAFILIAIVLLVVVLTLVPPRTANAVLASFTIVETIIAALCFAAIAVFLNWSSRFPFINFSTTARSLSHNASTKSDTANSIPMYSSDAESVDVAE